jgi:thiol:disulfide interchange protein
MRFDHGESRYSRYTRAPTAQNKRLVIYVVLLFGVVGAMIAFRHKAATPPSSQAGPIEWLLTFEEATARAEAKNTPIMAYFFAEDNAACQRMDVVTFADPTVRAEARKFICVRIDGATHPELVERYLHMNVYPSTAFISPEGELLRAAYNEREPDDLLREMRKALETGTLAPAPTEQPVAGNEPESGGLDESPSLPPRNAEPSRGAAE